MDMDVQSHFKYFESDSWICCRAEACRDKLQELNTAVAVTASSTELKEDFLSQFQVRMQAHHHMIAHVHGGLPPCAMGLYSKVL